MRDRASVNSLAMRTVSIIYIQVMESKTMLAAFAHYWPCRGEYQGPYLKQFCESLWLLCFHECRLLWHTQTGLSPPSYSNTRWWSQFEVIHHLLNAFGDVPTFLRGSDLSPATSAQLLAILQDPAKCRKLKMELVITVDAMQPFFQATYCL